MKTLIWDFNGTIIDDTQLSLDIENYMLAERHMKHGYTLEEYRDMFCFPVKDYYVKLGYDFSREPYESLSVEFNALYDRHFDECPLVEGAMDKIQEALKKGYQNVILSASLQENLDKQTEKLGIDSYFSERLGIDNMLAGSKVDMARQWMTHSGINPEECMYIGDTVHDKETADAIGIHNCILVAQGHQSYDVLKTASEQVVHTMKEVQL